MGISHTRDHTEDYRIGVLDLHTIVRTDDYHARDSRNMHERLSHKRLSQLRGSSYVRSPSVRCQHEAFPFVNGNSRFTNNLILFPNKNTLIESAEVNKNETQCSAIGPAQLPQGSDAAGTMVVSWWCKRISKGSMVVTSYRRVGPVVLHSIAIFVP